MLQELVIGWVGRLGTQSIRWRRGIVEGTGFDGFRISSNVGKQFMEKEGLKSFTGREMYWVIVTLLKCICVMEYLMWVRNKAPGSMPFLKIGNYTAQNYLN